MSWINQKSTPEKIQRFYQSWRWKKCRTYIKSLRNGICEECGTIGTEVHHIIPLTLANVDDPKISLDESNLQLLCAACHNGKRSPSLLRSDVEFDANGDMVCKKKV